jgi:hypothetical protein
MRVRWTKNPPSGESSTYHEGILQYLVGGCPTPLKNDGMKVNGKHYTSHIENGKSNSCLKPPTNYSYMAGGQNVYNIINWKKKHE